MDIRDKLSSIEKRILDKVKYRVFCRDDIFKISGFSEKKITKNIESLFLKRYVEKVFFSDNGTMLRKVKDWDVVDQCERHKNILHDIFSFFVREGVYSVNTWLRWAFFNGGFVIFLIDDGLQNIEEIEKNSGIVDSFVFSFVFSLVAVLKRLNRKKVRIMKEKKGEKDSLKEEWDSLVEKVEVSKFKKGDRICMNDIENMGCFDLEAQEDGFCVDAKGLHGIRFVVPRRFFDNAMSYEEREKLAIKKMSEKSLKEIPKKPKEVVEHENIDRVYFCECESCSFSVSEFNDFDSNNENGEYPEGFPEQWKNRNGRCSKCGALIKKRKV